MNFAFIAMRKVCWSMNKLIRRYHQLKMIPLIALSKILSCTRKKTHWVLHERGTDARDNAFFFYLYLKEKHPEQKVYYIVDKNSPDYDKVKEDAVHFGSLKNYWAIATAEKIISTHCFFGLPCMNSKLFRFCGLNRKFYFLQHGITGHFLSQMHFENSKIKMLFCAAKPEYEYMMCKYGYPEENLRYTGFARYDTLHNIKTKKQILIMPTWRIYLSDEKTFLESSYYHQWNQVLRDPQLAEYLEKNDLIAVFYPHFEMQKYLHHFQPGSDRIILGYFSYFDVQTLLKESKLLVTDYSSVFFDFAYMRKPVIYFQFDQEEFFSRHYSRGYFSYLQMGFGPVVDNCQDMICAIVQSAESGFCSTDEYLRRMDCFFPLNDQKNCERIYNAIRPA